ncbi:DUF1036 domain-containing protein [Paenibacillus sp. FSL L8-0470]|uniref:DUF1036 domain-containing protein n=1 Tax=unclassified Paenibacillus TaxID=185978 RepID=UPI0030F4D38A
MSLFFHNSTNSALRVAIYFPDMNRCGIPIIGERGILAAWYRLEPGQTRRVVSGRVGGSTFYYYAENVSRTLVWSGSFPIDVPNNGHNGCWSRDVPGSLCANCRRLRFRRINIEEGVVNFTINLITSSTLRKAKRKNVLTALPTKLVKKAPKPVNRKKL